MLESWFDGLLCDMMEEMSRLTAHIATVCFFGADEVKDREAFNLAVYDESARSVPDFED
jgi:hypothetical protein